MPKSLVGKAESYVSGRRSMLSGWIEDRHIEIDYNHAENVIRPAALGRKNWLFIDDKGAGWRSTVIYSIIISCRSRGIDPHAYLNDILTRLQTMANHPIPEVTNEVWAKAKEELGQVMRRFA